MQSTADLILFLGIALSTLIGIVIVGRMEEEKAKREMKRRRKDARRGATNYARIQALLALSAGTIKGEKN